MCFVVFISITVSYDQRLFNGAVKKRKWKIVDYSLSCWSNRVHMTFPVEPVYFLSYLQRNQSTSAFPHLCAKRQGAHIKQQQLASGSVAAKHTGLNSGAVGDSLIGIDALVRGLTVEEVLDQLLHFGNTRGSANKDDLVHISLFQARVLQDLSHGFEGGAEKVLRKEERKIFS